MFDEMRRFLIICQTGCWCFTHQPNMALAVHVLRMNADLMYADWTNGGVSACLSAGVLIFFSSIYSGQYINTPESCSAFFFLFFFFCNMSCSQKGFTLVTVLDGWWFQLTGCWQSALKKTEREKLRERNAAGQ